MFGTYKQDDVTILLKDLTNCIEPMDTLERERRIQQGVHYSEMLPVEYEPSEQYLRAYFDAVERYAAMTADAVASVCQKLWQQKGERVVLVSLARAGTSIGVLLKRYFRFRYGVDVPHYTISIIRGRGIDETAMAYILERHPAETIQFVDGWTGKGAIQAELYRAVTAYKGVDGRLAVLSDPAGLTDLCGTKDDFLIASSCLNSTVSGLLSRTVYRTDLIGPEEFHGAVFYESLRPKDLTYQFIDAIAAHFSSEQQPEPDPAPKSISALEEVEQIRQEFSISDRNLVKPSIGETTRVLLRRVPWKILVHSLDDEAYLGHIYALAKEKGVELCEYPLVNYRACGLIRTMADQ